MCSAGSCPGKIESMTENTRPGWRIYHTVLRRLIPILYRQASAQRYSLVLALCSPDIRTTTPGDSALGGTRHTRAGYRLWWRRVFRICAALDLRLHSVSVTGPPWDTRLRTEWTDYVLAHDGRVFVNHGTHDGRMRWGRIVELRYSWDSDVVRQACEHVAAIGFPEASAPPISN